MSGGGARSVAAALAAIVLSHCCPGTGAAQQTPAAVPAHPRAFQSVSPTVSPIPPAATQPGGAGAAPAGPQLPAEFDILRTRNPFARGTGRPGGPGAPAGPEAGFVLKGIAQSGDRYSAFIEDAMSKRVMELAGGSPVALGRIKSVDIDTIEYEAMGASRRVEVGQNLAGQVVPPTPASQPAGPPGPQPPPGQPGGEGPVPGAGEPPMPPGARRKPVRGAPAPDGGPPPDAQPAAPQEK